MHNTSRGERLNTAVSDGHYYRKQLGCQSRIIAWSHRSRFHMALRLIGDETARLLDYGCGDGTFLALAAERIEHGRGADIAQNQIEDCRVRLGGCPNLRFCHVADLAEPAHDRAYDIVTCMETLEHCTQPVVGEVLNDLARLVAPHGEVIISVPIETGPTFLVKAVVRRLAAGRGLSDYRYYERYPRRDALRMIFAGPGTEIERPVYGPPSALAHSHYGFNWRRLRRRINDYLLIKRTHFTPLGFLGGGVSSQVWFVCGPKRSTQAERPQRLEFPK